MIMAFTGTLRGMTQRQAASVRYLFHELQVNILHHGDAVGADAQVHRIARTMDIGVYLHPSTNKFKRAFCTDAITIMPALLPLVRNKNIVEATEALIAAPGTMREVLRSGTWTTVRYARKLRRRRWLVFPDGTFREELSSVGAN